MKQFLSRVVLSSFMIFAGFSSVLRADSAAPADTSSDANSVATPIVTPIATNAPAQSAVSANTPTELSEVVVTANRLDTPVSQVSSSITVITAQDIQQKQANTVMQAIEGVPGLTNVQTGPPGEVDSIYIRGGNPEHTLVLMDGVPLNDPVGAPAAYGYLDQISTDDVKQIEVVRGPQSTLFGSSAMGGVINIITQSGPASLGGSVLMEGGSYGTSHEAASAQGGDESGNFSVNVSHFNTAGFPTLDVKGLDAADAAVEPSNAGTVNNGDDNNTASLRLGSILAPNLNETILARYNQSNTSLDTFNSSFILADDPDYFVLQKQLMIGSHSDWKLLGGDWEQILDVSFVDDNRLYNGTSNVYNTYFEQGNFDGQTLQATWQNNIRLVKEETIVVGIQGQGQWANESDANGYTDASYLDLTDSVSGNTQLATGFVESHTSIEDRLLVDLSGRFDAHSQYGTHTTYQTGLAYFVPVLDTKLKANYGTAFLAPSLYQLYDPNYGNPALLPETSTGWDVGFEQAIGKKVVTVGADYFDNDYTNLFEFVTTSYVPYQGHNINIGTATTYGVESFATFTGIDNLNVRASYTYTNAQDTVTNTALLHRPQHMANADLDYKWDNLSVGTSVSYTGADFDTDFYGNPVTLPGYFLVDLRASYQVNHQVDLFARVNNLFNQYYEQAYGYSTPGLSVYGGTKVSF